MDLHLALMVRGAASIEIAVAHGGLEGGRSPQLQRLGGLHVVVPIEKDGGLAGRPERFAINHRMHFRRNDLDAVQAHAPQSVRNPLCRALDVRLVVGLRAHAGNPQKLVKIGKMLVVLSLYVLVQVHLPSGKRVPILGAPVLRCKGPGRATATSPCPHGQFAPEKRKPSARLTAREAWPTMNGSCPSPSTNANAAVPGCSCAYGCC